MVKSHVHNFANAVSIDVVHAKSTDAMISKYLLLRNIDVTKTDIHNLGRVDSVFIFNPTKDIRVFNGCLGNSSQEGNWHAMDVAGARRLRSVDICMGINPDEGHLRVIVAFTDCLCGSGNGTNSNGVVTTQGENKASLGSMFVNLTADSMCSIGNSNGVDHGSLCSINVQREVSSGGGEVL